MTPEADLQKVCIKYMGIKYPFAFIVHIPSEGKRTFAMINWLKSLGFKTGMPDLLIFNPAGKFNGLAIELKTSTGKLTELQEKRLEQLKSCKWRAEVCRGYEQFCGVVDQYFINAKGEK